jgi:hypothetical protein
MSRAGTIGVCAASGLLSAVGGAGLVLYDKVEERAAKHAEKTKPTLESELARHKATANDAGLAASSDTGITVVSPDAGALAQALEPDASLEPDAAPGHDAGIQEGTITVALLGGIDLTGISEKKNIVKNIERHLQAPDLVVAPLHYFPQLGSPMFSQLHLDVAVLAHPNAGDFGPGIDYTLESLNNMSIMTAGVKNKGSSTKSSDKTVAIKEVKGKRICTFAYSANASSDFVNRISIAAGIGPVERQLSYNKCDLKIVYLNWGKADDTRPNIPMEKFAKKVVKAGADIVIGHGGNYMQPMENVGQGRSRSHIFYSLGKLVSCNHKDPEITASAILLAEYDIAQASLVLKYHPTQVEKSGDKFFSAFSAIDLNKKIKACKGSKSKDCQDARKAYCFSSEATSQIGNTDDNLIVKCSAD